MTSAFAHSPFAPLTTAHHLPSPCPRRHSPLLSTTMTLASHPPAPQPSTAIAPLTSATMPSAPANAPAAVAGSTVVDAPPRFPLPTPDAVNDPVTPIVGSDAFLGACACSQEKLVVVQVKAPWCRSCKALEPKVRRLAREFADDVRFFEMNYEDLENKPIAYRLGVKRMPTFLFYRGEAGKVEQFTCGPNRASLLREKIENYVSGYCAYEGEK